MRQIEDQETISLRPNTRMSIGSANRFAIFTESINRKINIKNEEGYSSSNPSSPEVDSSNESEGKEGTENRLWSDIMEDQDVKNGDDDNDDGFGVWTLKTKKMGKKSKMFLRQFNPECFQKQHEKEFDEQEKELNYMVKYNSIPYLEDYNDCDEKDGKVYTGYESCEEKEKVTYIGRDWY